MTTEAIQRAYNHFTTCSLEIGKIQDRDSSLELTSSRNTSPAFGPRTIDLTRASGWEFASVEVSVTVPSSELGAVLGKDEHVDTLEVLAVAASSRSKYRSAIRLHRTSEHGWTGRLVIARARVFGSVEVRARVCRQGELALPQPRRAGFPGVILAEATPVELVVDEIERRFSGLIQFSWVNFDTSLDPRFSENKESLLVVETDKSPTIFLNSAVEGFQAALLSSQKSGSIAVARQSLASLVAGQAWQAFLTAAICAIVYDEETDTCVVGSGWKGALVKRASKAMYPDLDEVSAIKATHDDWRDNGATDVMVSRLASLAQKWSKNRSLVQRAINAVDTSAESL